MKKYWLLLLLAGCSLAPEYKRPETPKPAPWSAARSDLAHWWEGFKSPELAALENKALAQNLDLRQAVQRIEEARAAAGIARSALWPQAEASGNVASGTRRIAGQRGAHSSSVGAGADVSYALDLFGANRDSVRAAEAGARGSVYDYQALALTVSAETAQSYFGVLALKERLRLAQESRGALQKTLGLLQDRFDAGVASALDLEQQKAEVARQDASIAALQDQLTAAQNGLALLLGLPPRGYAVAGAGLGGLALPAVAPGQPSQLLERRPDIRAAEESLIAANADIGVARAAFFPSINLGLAPSISVSPLANPAVSALSLTSSLSAPLFKGGRLTSQLAQAKAREAELAEGYRKSVLTAFGEVENALSAQTAAARRLEALTRANDSAARAYGIAQDQFKAGTIDYTALLVSERSMLSARDSLVSATLDRFTAAVDLYKALGGSWN